MKAQVLSEQDIHIASPFPFHSTPSPFPDRHNSRCARHQSTASDSRGRRKRINRPRRPVIPHLRHKARRGSSRALTSSSAVSPKSIGEAEGRSSARWINQRFTQPPSPWRCGSLALGDGGDFGAGEEGSIIGVVPSAVGVERAAAI
ncbi:hypothetical protein C2845_PM11G19400 [Panicum miliaceum]|uniref:Uncharacterized protein n=1 Tax=Panicum miliaceum TaxID=4540 RepID=A0A3L6RTJ6_PANMI|nr:hypothetical protein C2845_PM11G19400 [Panicum miliaceum]